MQPDYFRGCFMRHVFGDIRNSLWKDFKDRIEENGIDESLFDFNESLMTATYRPTGNSIISKGFRKSSGTHSAKMKSLAGMTHVLIEEAEECSEEEFNQLDDTLRTVKVDTIQIICLFNPPSKNHWLIRRFYNLTESEYKGYYTAEKKQIDGFTSIHTTYRDNISNMNRTTVEKFMAYGNPSSHLYNPDHYYTMVEGLVSEGAKGRIFRDWKFIKSMPDEGYDMYYGLDFGYSSDPVALVEIQEHNNKAYARELIYMAGLTNPELSRLMEDIGVDKSLCIYADSAEPKSIQELQDLGWFVEPALKGTDSVNAGIKYIQSKIVHLTEDSPNAALEYQEYKWALDKEKNPTDRAEDKNNHFMDAFRYGLYTHSHRSYEYYIG